MKQSLEQLNTYILDIQKKQTLMYGGFDEMHYMYFDKISFSEYQGQFEITWFGGDYGTSSYLLDELASYKPNDDTQHCLCECEDQSDCECEYEGQGLSWLIDVLIAHPDKIRSLTFTGPDSGANGIRDWNFDRLLENDVLFPNLIEFKVQCHEVGDHNLNMIGHAEDDHQQVSQLLRKMSNVVSIELPSTPDESFFAEAFPKLKHLKIQAGHDGAYFIRNLSKSKLLSQITLDFTDVWHDEELSYINTKEREMQQKIKQQQEMIANAEDPKAAKKMDERRLLKEAGFSEEEIALDLDNPNREETLRLLKIICEDDQEVKESMEYFYSNDQWDENREALFDGDFLEDHDFEDDYELSESYQKRTLFEDYMALFTSEYAPKAPDSLHFKLRECYLTQKQLFELQNANRAVQFLHIPTTEDYYVSHRMQDADLWL